jgi:hypothetical protein
LQLIYTPEEVAREESRPDRSSGPKDNLIDKTIVKKDERIDRIGSLVIMILERNIVRINVKLDKTINLREKMLAWIEEKIARSGVKTVEKDVREEEGHRLETNYSLALMAR